MLSLVPMLQRWNTYQTFGYFYVFPPGTAGAREGAAPNKLSAYFSTKLFPGLCDETKNYLDLILYLQHLLITERCQFFR